MLRPSASALLVTHTAVSHNNAREGLRAARARQRLLFELSQRLRDTRSDRQTIAVVTGLLARYFDALRVGYAEVEPDGVHVRIEQDWVAHGAVSIAGRHHLSSYGPRFEAEYRAGRPVAVSDFRTDPRSAGQTGQFAHEAVGVRALLAAPVLRQGRMVALLFVHSQAPRLWSTPDCDLVAEAAEWTWWVIENARVVRRLRESEARAEENFARLDLALTAAQQGVFEWDLRSDAVQLDPRAREIFGFRPGEGRSQPELFQRVHPADRRRVQRLMSQDMAAGMRARKEYRLLLPGGVVRYVACVGLVTAGADGRAERAIGVFADVSEHRWQELQYQALARLEERARDLEQPQDVLRAAADVLGASLGASRAGHGRVDLQARRLRVESERKTRAPGSIAGEHALGPQAGRFEALREGDVVLNQPPASDARGRLPLLRALQSQSLLCAPVSVRGDVACILFVAHDTPHEWSRRERGFTRDLVERVRTLVDRAEGARALRESAEREGFLVRLGDLLRSLEDAESLQTQAARLLGEQLQADQVLYAETPPGDPQARPVARGWRREGLPLPADGTPFADFACQVLQMHAGGTRVMPDLMHADLDAAQRARYESHAIRAQLVVPLRSRGRVVACLAVHQATTRAWTAQDIWLAEQAAERIRSSVKRAHAEAALHEAARRKDEFLATLGHELRNPLAPVRNGLKILRLAPPGSPPAQRAIDTMERQVSHIVRLIDDLLDVSRITHGKLELRRQPVLLASVIDSAVEAMRAHIEAGRLALQVEMPGEPLPLFADPTRLTQVVSNLLKNAADYTPEGGHIALRVHREGAQAVVSVSDSGIGIDPEMLPRIFDFFTQAGRRTDRSQGGLGIGLSISRRLVELHGGTLQADSEGPGKGAVFAMRLPLAPPEGASGGGG